MPAEPPPMVCEAPLAVDGDTIACRDGTRLRLVAINAREHDGSCRRNAPCPTASAASASAELARWLRLGPVTYRPLYPNRDRMVARVTVTWGSGIDSVTGPSRSHRADLSCALVRSGHAAPWTRYGEACE